MAEKELQIGDTVTIGGVVLSVNKYMNRATVFFEKIYPSYEKVAPDREAKKVGIAAIVDLEDIGYARQEQRELTIHDEEHIFQYFKYDHLPTLELRELSKVFHGVAFKIIKTLARNPERTAGLRKLLEAKDCAVRAALAKGHSKK